MGGKGPSLKRKQPDSSHLPPTKQKRNDEATLLGPDSHKGKLYKLARDNNLPLPIFKSLTSSDLGFSTTVEYDGNSFKSVGQITNRKLAEDSACHVALYVLGEIDH